ncbi:ATP-grasp domain-containing protein [Actinoplanes sp. HUAS TT8]|uniref:ATP-grasp domain-containing protein n=1 Tax=Actinoplanes sp. HUAS TT8 TaxID=3447453 RepID=UPI003F52666E
MMVNVFSDGSVPPAVIAEAAERFGGCLFVVEPDDADAMALLPVLEELGDALVADSVEAFAAAFGDGTPAGVVAFADRSLRFASELARHYRLPGLSEKSAQWCRDKVAQRERLNACGVGDVRSAPMNDGVYPAEVPLPAVVKPRDGAGSEDTVFVHSEAEFRTLTSQINPHRPYVVEQFIEGVGAPFAPWLADQVSVESAVDAFGGVRHIGITLRTPLAEPARETGLVFPAVGGTELTDELLTLAADAIAAVEFTSGVTHIEFKIGPKGPVVIEVNGRLGGGLYRLMPQAATVEPVALAMALAAGEPLPEAFPVPVGHAMHYYAQPPFGAVAVTALPRSRQLLALPGVFRADQKIRAGAAIDWRTGSGGRVFDIWIEGPDLAELGDRKAAVDRFLEETITWEFE